MYPGTRLASDEARTPVQGVVVVVYLCGVLTGIGPQHTSGVLHKPTPKRDRRREEQRVKNRTVEPLPDV